MSIIICNNVVFCKLEDKMCVYELNDQKLGWNKLTLSDSLLSCLKSTHSLIKVNNVKKNNDTIEIPFFIENVYKIDSIRKVPIDILDTNIIEGKRYYTISSDTTKILSCMEFSLGRKQFKSNFSLEGSNDKEEWTTISDSILLGKRFDRHQQISSESIYNLDNIYNYYRMGVDTNQSELAKVRYQNIYKSIPEYKRLKIRSIKQRENKKKKLTILEFKLKYKLPINLIKLDVKKNFTVDRNAELFGLVDSVVTASGVKYNYKLLESFAITNSDTNDFVFSYPEHFEQYKIQISNGEKERIKVLKLSTYRYEYILKSMFADSGNSFIELCNYGSKPFYNIEKFKSRAPNNMNEMNIGAKIESNGLTLDGSPKFSDKKLIWAALALMVLLIAVFSLRKIKRINLKNNNA